MTNLLREYIRELLKEEDLTRNPETVGDLKALINIALSTKRADIGKAGAKSLAAGILADLFPGGGTAAGTVDVFRAMYSMPDEKRTGTGLDYLDVDDEVSAIVDDNVETRFLKSVADKLSNMQDDKPLTDLNMTKLLARYIGKEFNSRTVTGFDE